MAVNPLAKAGFVNVYNIIDGMEGDKVNDPGSVNHGKRMRNGWKNSGLPWTYDINPEMIGLPSVGSGKTNAELASSGYDQAIT